MNFSADQDRDEDRGGLGGEEQAQLGQKLREAYADVIEQPVPDRFLDLLAKLEAGEKSEGGQG